MDEKQIFLEALQIKAIERRVVFLVHVCGQDAALRRRIETLLRSYAQGESKLRTPQLGGQTKANQSTETQSITVDLGFLAPDESGGSLGRLGDYEILTVLGHGGMGIVLKAQDTNLNRTVAVKVLAPALSAVPSARQRFIREAQAAAAVSSARVVTTHAVEAGADIPYLVMEYIHGKTLQEKIDQQGPLPLAEILRIGTQIARGLAAAHSQGIVHRDMKPSNVLLENRGEQVKIADFGLARAAADRHLTHPGEVVGTPEYMSPEQARGEAVDHRTDLFSLGSILYTMTTGCPPFRAPTTLAVMRRVCETPPTSIRKFNPDLPNWLIRIIERLLAKQPHKRYQTASDVADLLSHHLDRLPAPSNTQTEISVCGPSAGPAAARREHPWRRAARAITMFLLLVATVCLFQLPSDMRLGLGTAERTGTEYAATAPTSGKRHEPTRTDPTPVSPQPASEDRSRPSHPTWDHQADQRLINFVLNQGGKVELLDHQDQLLTIPLASKIPEGGIREYHLTLWGMDDQTFGEFHRLLAGCPKLTRLHLTKLSAEFTQVSLDKIAQIQTLDFLRLGRMQRDGGPYQFEVLARINNLRALYFEDSPDIGDAFVVAASKIPQLTVFGINNCPFTDRSLPHLTKLTNLVKLMLLSDTEMRMQSIRSLQPFPSLRILELGFPSINDEIWEILLGFPTLHTAKVGYYRGLPELSGEGISVLNGSTLRLLSFNNLGWTDQGFGEMTQIKNILHIGLLKSVISDKRLSYLEHAKHLRGLDLRYVTISKRALERLRASLPYCRIICPVASGAVVGR